MMDLLRIGALGALGGVANSLLLEGGFALPKMVTIDQERRIWRPGFLGSLLLGIIAALATSLLGGEHLDQWNRSGLALVSGVGGGNVLQSLLQKQEASALKLQMEGLSEALRRALTPAPDPPGSIPRPGPSVPPPPP